MASPVSTKPYMGLSVDARRRLRHVHLITHPSPLPSSCVAQPPSSSSKPAQTQVPAVIRNPQSGLVQEKEKISDIKQVLAMSSESAAARLPAAGQHYPQTLARKVAAVNQLQGRPAPSPSTSSNGFHSSTLPSSPSASASASTTSSASHHQSHSNGRPVPLGVLHGQHASRSAVRAAAMITGATPGQHQRQHPSHMAPSRQNMRVVVTRSHEARHGKRLGRQPYTMSRRGHASSTGVSTQATTTAQMELASPPDTSAHPQNVSRTSGRDDEQAAHYWVCIWQAQSGGPAMLYVSTIPMNDHVDAALAAQSIVYGPHHVDKGYRWVYRGRSS